MLLALPSAFLNEVHVQYFRSNRRVLEVVADRLRQGRGGECLWAQTNTFSPTYCTPTTMH